MLEVQNLSVIARNGDQLLNQISFQIETGEAVGLTGQSGAGKTTLLKALLGILSGGCQVSGGTIQVDGQSLWALSPRKRRERIGELMELTHMEERLLEIPARQLSGGEQRRLSLVRAMSIRPKYLVLDEVLSGLDLISADAVMRVLEQYHREFDCAFLLITHDMDSAYRLSDTILTMQAGQIVRVGIKQ